MPFQGNYKGKIAIKALAGTNALAYLDFSSMMLKKVM
jgi:hypothetical protein